MQTYGQNRTPQQQMFNRFPQRFQQPQPVAQPAQGPVYADQSLNAPGNQPQQQPQYGNFGRGFMPQNRGGYERQMDQLRGGYNRPMPPMMQINPQPYAAYNTYIESLPEFAQQQDLQKQMQSLPEYAQQQDLQKQIAALSAKMQADPQGTTMRNALQANARQIMPRYDPRPPSPEEYARRRGYQHDPAPSAAPADAEAAWNRTTALAQFAPGTDMVKAKQDFMQRYNPRPQQPGGMQQAAFMNSLLNGQQQGAQQAARYVSPEERNSMEAYYRQDALDQAGRPRFSNLPSMDAGFGDPRGFNFGATPALNTQASSAGAAALGQQQMPSLRGQQIPYSSSMDAGMGDPRGYANNSLLSGQQQMPAYNGPTQAQWGQMKNQPVTSYEARPSFGESQQTGVSQLNPFQAALVKGGTPYVQGAPGAPYAIGQGIPGGAPGGYMPLMNSNGTPVSSLASANPVGGKGGNSVGPTNYQ
jgi:hypothetical protein